MLQCVGTNQLKAQPCNAPRPAPHNPSHPSLTGDLTGQASARPPLPSDMVLCGMGEERT
ncbi:hypothetical protein BD311DRAFT_752982 [Dichomitus squalens]|uniref:Uncharacterized protein n=1 Tax=Dichomitus squalens TaxID=114155 RepID=A0A4Q9MY79_9APHY|nr:hypothetical protein BD311DRAFT_752982 [Dichomitus squalens]